MLSESKDPAMPDSIFEDINKTDTTKLVKPSRKIPTNLTPIVVSVNELTKVTFPSQVEFLAAKRFTNLEAAESAMREVKEIQTNLSNCMVDLKAIRSSVARDIEFYRKKASELRANKGK
jgi:hypothetical protein